MNNIKLHIVVSDNKNLFNKLNTITNTIIKPEYKSIIYKKHSGLKNGCNKCWLNAGIQMIGYMDDISQQIINMNPSGDPIKNNFKKLFKDLLNGTPPINYGTTFDLKQNHGNLYQYILQTLMKIEYKSFEDAAEGLDNLFNYFKNIYINIYNIEYKNIITRQCLEGDPNPSIQIQKEIIYRLDTPILEGPIINNRPIIPLDNLNDYINNFIKEKHIDDEDNYREGCTSQTRPNYGPYKEITQGIPRKYLIIQLKLFSINDGVSKKTPPNLNISKKIIINNNKYYLSGFIVHIGSTIHGYHYVFYKVLPDGSGILYDDRIPSDISPSEIERLLTQNIVAKTPYILLYEKREFTGYICNINYNIKISYTETDIINDKLECYSNGVLTNFIYDNFIFNEFVFVNNTLYYKINITEQNKQNLNLLIDVLCKNLFINESDYNIIKEDTEHISIKILEFQPDCDKDLILGIVNSLLNKISESETINNFNFKIL